MKKYILLCAFTMVSVCALHSQKNYTAKDYDIPPGNVFLPKYHVQTDYSFKLSEIPRGNVTPIYEDILKEYTQEDLLKMKTLDPNRYAYMMRLKAYFDALSDKVKVTFTHDELWYIYIYDKELRNKLTTIR
jgi:hypothetical protein